jgi:hypothetical protein
MSAAHQMANILNPRIILWSQGHPERRLKKNKKATEEQEAIVIEDAVADGCVAELQSQQLPTIQHTFTLSRIYNELIPGGEWHICRNDDRDVPVLDNIMRYQNRAQFYQHLAD